MFDIFIQIVIILVSMIIGILLFCVFNAHGDLYIWYDGFGKETYRFVIKDHVMDKIKNKNYILLRINAKNADYIMERNEFLEKGGNHEY